MDQRGVIHSKTRADCRIFSKRHHEVDVIFTPVWENLKRKVRSHYLNLVKQGSFMVCFGL